MRKSWIPKRIDIGRYLHDLTAGPDSSGIRPFDPAQVRPVYLLRFICIMGIVTLVPFGILGLLKNNISAGIADLSLATFLIANYLHARRYKRYTLNYSLVVIAAAILFVDMFLTMGVNTGGFLWYYAFPVAACFLLGSKKGAMATALISAPVIVFFLIRNPPSIFTNYSLDFKLRFLFSFCVVFAFSYLFEYTREKNWEQLQIAHGDLEKRFDERTLALQALQEANQSLEEEISERRRIEEALRESEEKYRTILEEMEEGYFESDLMGNLTFINDAVCGHLGYPRQELVGMNYRVYTDEENAKKVFQTFNEAYKARQPCRLFDYEITRKDGTKVIIELSASLIRDPEGKPIGFRGVSRDVTERKKAEEVLRIKTRELARSNRDLEQFAYVASHDLQEPLRMVTSYVQLLAQRYNGKLDSDADEFIGFAMEGASRMRKLINDLLTYSRVKTQGRALEPTDCESVLDQSLDNLKVAIEENGALVTHGPLPTVMADSAQLVALFQNLIGNAIKFRGTQPPRIHISAGRDGNGWIFSVRDNGIGIAPEYSKRIFVIFQRLHGRDKYEGTGIGLAICKRIVERHEGRIWVESKPGKGATFYFTLPANQRAQEMNG
jgi:PAS domain S-box-containing protein